MFFSAIAFLILLMIGPSSFFFALSALTLSVRPLTSYNKYRQRVTQGKHSGNTWILCHAVPYFVGRCGWAHLWAQTSRSSCSCSLLGCTHDSNNPNRRKRSRELETRAARLFPCLCLWFSPACHKKTSPYKQASH